MDDSRQTGQSTLSLDNQAGAGSYYQPIGGSVDVETSTVAPSSIPVPPAPIVPPSASTLSPTVSPQYSQPIPVEPTSAQVASSQAASPQVAAPISSEGTQSPPQAEIVKNLQQLNNQSSKKSFPLIPVLAAGAIILVLVMAWVAMQFGFFPSATDKVIQPVQPVGNVTTGEEADNTLPSYDVVDPAQFVSADDPGQVVVVTERDEFNLFEQAHPPTQTMSLNGDMNGQSVSGSVYVAVDEQNDKTYIYTKLDGLVSAQDNLFMWVFNQDDVLLEKQVAEAVDTENGRDQFMATVVNGQVASLRIGFSLEQSRSATSPTGNVFYAE